MAYVPTALDTLTGEQAREVHAAKAPLPEHVAASVSRVTGFSNAGRSASGHAVPVDEPAAFGGGGTASDPAELLLIAVGASLSVTITVHASLAAVTIDAIDMALSGTLDAGRFFTPSDAVGGGFTGLRCAVAVGTRAAPGAVRRVLNTAILASPVLRSLAATPTVTLTVNGVAA